MNTIMTIDELMKQIGYFQESMLVPVKDLKNFYRPFIEQGIIY